MCAGHVSADRLANEMASEADTTEEVVCVCVRVGKGRDGLSWRCVLVVAWLLLHASFPRFYLVETVVCRGKATAIKASMASAHSVLFHAASD